MSSKKIEREIADLQKRREALAFDAATAQRDLEDARKGLVAGKVKVAEVTATQSTYAALSETLLALDRTIKDTRAQLAEAERVAELRAEAARGRAREDRRRVLTAEIHALLKNANVYLEGAVSTYFEKVEEWRASGGVGPFRPPAVEPFGVAIALAVNIEDRRRSRQRSKAAAGRATERERQRNSFP
jgi:predicted  nucleic acid-binding Zn-ribbon protein